MRPNAIHCRTLLVVLVILRPDTLLVSHLVLLHLLDLLQVEVELVLALVDVFVIVTAVSIVSGNAAPLLIHDRLQVVKVALQFKPTRCMATLREPPISATLASLRDGFLQGGHLGRLVPIRVPLHDGC